MSKISIVLMLAVLSAVQGEFVPNSIVLRGDSRSRLLPPTNQIFLTV